MYATLVRIKSSQTNRKTGEIIRIIENDVWGVQYLVQTYHPEWGYENFWMREHEIVINTNT